MSEAWDLPVFQNNVMTYKHPRFAFPAKVSAILATGLDDKKYKIIPNGPLINAMLTARKQNLMTCRALSIPTLTYGFKKGFMIAKVEIKQLDFTLTDAVYGCEPSIKQEAEEGGPAAKLAEA